MKYGCPYHRTDQELDSFCYWCRLKESANQAMEDKVARISQAVNQGEQRLLDQDRKVGR